MFQRWEHETKRFSVGSMNKTVQCWEHETKRLSVRSDDRREWGGRMNALFYTALYWATLHCTALCPELILHCTELSLELALHSYYTLQAEGAHTY